MTREQLIKLIHIAKNQLKLDDDTYRNFLTVETGKNSCTKMLKAELEQVYSAMQQRGFVYSGVKKKYGKPAVKVARHRDDIKKIKAIWITMGQQGFIHDASDKALDVYCERMTKAKNGGIGIRAVAWLDGDFACHILESIKQFHLRVIVKHFLMFDGVTYSESSKTICYKGQSTSGYANIAGLYEHTFNKKGVKK